MHDHADQSDTHTCDHGESHSHGELGQHHGGGRDAICIDNVSFRYADAGGRAVGQDHAGDDGLILKNINLHIPQGCNLGVIGPNGAGKTTLVKIILGLLDGYTGSVSVMDMSPTQACKQGNIIGYVPQRHDVEWRFPISARQAVLMGLTGKTGLFRRFSSDDMAYADDVMRRVGVAELRERPVGQLSGGQQQRLFIARALVAQPKVLILDEPLVGVDEAGQQRFAGLIHDLHESLGLTIVIVSHDIQAIAAGCNRVACLRKTIHFHDAPDGLTRDVLNEVFAHEIAPIAQ